MELRGLISILLGEAKSLTVQSLKCDGLETWMLRSSELSDQIMFAFTTNFAGSTYINFGLLVRISWTFLLVNFCTFFTIEIKRTDSPGSKNCCLFTSCKYILDYENLHAKLMYPSKWMVHCRYNNGQAYCKQKWCWCKQERLRNTILNRRIQLR